MSEFVQGYKVEGGARMQCILSKPKADSLSPVEHYVITRSYRQPYHRQNKTMPYSMNRQSAKRHEEIISSHRETDSCNSLED